MDAGRQQVVVLREMIPQYYDPRSMTLKVQKTHHQTGTTDLEIEEIHVVAIITVQQVAESVMYTNTFAI